MKLTIYQSQLIILDYLIKVIDDGVSSVLSDPAQNDDSFDSMTLTLTMARAPIVNEDQL